MKRWQRSGKTPKEKSSTDSWTTIWKPWIPLSSSTMAKISTRLSTRNTTTAFILQIGSAHAKRSRRLAFPARIWSCAPRNIRQNHIWVCSTRDGSGIFRRPKKYYGKAQWEWNSDVHRYFCLIILIMSKKIGDYVYDENRELGKGSFGAVYLGIHKATLKQVAVKVISLARFP